MKIVIFLILAVLFVTAGVVYAASDGFSIDWWTVDGGGGTSQGSDYKVSGTIGQPDVGPLMTGDDFSVVGGFWGGVKTILGSGPVYLPLILTDK